jgi:NADH-quinone oxidoreductase subunit N
MTGMVDLRPAVPALIVALTGLVVLLAQAFTPKGKSSPSLALSLTGLLGALLSVWLMANGRGLGSDLGDSLVADHFALAFQALALAVTLVSVLLSASYLRSAGLDRGEHYTLMLFSLVGMLGLVSTTELVSLFVALEIMSIALYALAGVRRDRPESQEAALKYFVTGAFSSAFFLYGVALLYGVSGSTRLEQIGQAVAALPAGERGFALLGVGFLLVGLGFKVASVPFHMWAPDVYEGAPTTVTAFMAAGVKVAAFGAFLRIFGRALGPLGPEWQPAAAVLAIVTMVIGNLAALAQTNVKRMLAYSSIAHAGYLLTAFVAPFKDAAPAVLFYLVGYAAVSLGGFGALAALAKDGREPLSFSDLNGLAARRPALAAALTVFLISLTGVPVSAGFLGKFYLFSAAVNAGYVGLALVGVLMSVVSAYYYLHVVVSMYMKDPHSDDPWAAVAPATTAALGIAVAVVLGFGIFPGRLVDFARHAAQTLR